MHFMECKNSNLKQIVVCFMIILLNGQVRIVEVERELVMVAESVAKYKKS